MLVSQQVISSKKSWGAAVERLGSGPPFIAVLSTEGQDIGRGEFDAVLLHTCTPSLGCGVLGGTHHP